MLSTSSTSNEGANNEGFILFLTGVCHSHSQVQQQILAIAHWVLTAFKKHPVDYPSLVCIIQRGSCCVQAAQLRPGPCEKCISIASYWGNDIWSCVEISSHISVPDYHQMCCSSSVNVFSHVSLFWVLFISHGKATRGPETAVRKAMSDQLGATEAKQRPGWVQHFSITPDEKNIKCNVMAITICNSNERSLRPQTFWLMLVYTIIVSIG